MWSKPFSMVQEQVINILTFTHLIFFFASKVRIINEIIYHWRSNPIRVDLCSDFVSRFYSPDFFMFKFNNQKSKITWGSSTGPMTHHSFFRCTRKNDQSVSVSFASQSINYLNFFVKPVKVNYSTNVFQKCVLRTLLNQYV